MQGSVIHAVVVEIAAEGCAKIDTSLPPGPACEESTPGFTGPIGVAVVPPLTDSQLRLRSLDDFVACASGKGRRRRRRPTAWLPTISPTNLAMDAHGAHGLWPSNAIHHEAMRTLVGFDGGNGIGSIIPIRSGAGFIL